MKKIKLMVFDFDGTLIDTSKDLAEAMNHALKKAGLCPVSREKVWSYTGDGTPLLIQRILKDKNHPELYNSLFTSFIKYYEAHFADFAYPTPGVKDMLEYFYNKNKKMAVLSNKYERFVVKLLDEFELKKYFFAIYGKDSFERSKPDPYPLFKIMEDAESSKEETVFIGDSKNDILISKNAGVKCFIIPSGVTPIDEIKRLKPYKILSEITELEKYTE
jgi:phosphoglycolate phosphatase